MGSFNGKGSSRSKIEIFQRHKDCMCARVCAVYLLVTVVDATLEFLARYIADLNGSHKGDLFAEGTIPGYLVDDISDTSRYTHSFSLLLS